MRYRALLREGRIIFEHYSDTESGAYDWLRGQAPSLSNHEYEIWDMDSGKRLMPYPGKAWSGYVNLENRPRLGLRHE